MHCADCDLEAPDGMRFCGRCGRPLADAAPVVAPAHADERVERRHMTVLFCDLVGSTPLAETVDPEELRDLLADFQNRCADAIVHFEGHVSKFMGDGMLAYFGYPVAHEDDPHRAVHAALSILDSVEHINASRPDRVELEVRVGVHTGLVVAGEMGAAQAVESFAIVGETPNIAARLESIAEPGTVVVSEVTQRLVDGFFVSEPRGRIPLKGVSRPLDVFRIACPSDVRERVEVTARGPLTPLVGRRAELALLIDQWVGVEDGGGGAVAHLVGEAGMGKSRVVRAVREELAGARRASFIWQCSPYHGHSALYPIVSFLQRWLDIENAEPDAQRATIARALSQAGVDSARARRLLGGLIGVDPDGAGDGAEISPMEARAELLLLVDALVVSNPDHHPLLLIVEDLHWADPTMLDFLRRVVDRIDGVPVMGLFTYRPEFTPPWSAVDLELELGPLSDRDVQEMVDATIEREDLRADVRRRVEQEAGGIPLYVEEMIRMLSTRGWRAATGAEAADDDHAVPATLRGLLTARLDRLADAREIAEIASVLGREFRIDLLEELVPYDRAQLAGAIEHLVAEKVLHPMSTAPIRYEFTHALLQETAYAMLLRRRRREIHVRAATTIIERFPEQARTEPETLARHLALAGDHRNAVAYFRQAGERALSGAAYLEAIDHFRRGLESIEELEVSDAQQDLMAEFLTLAAHSAQAGLGYANPEVEDLYRRARAISERRGDEARLLWVLRGQWHFFLIRGDYATASDIALEVLDVGAASGDAGVIAEGHTFAGMCASFLARHDEARTHLTEAIRLIGAFEVDRPMIDTLGDIRVMSNAYLAPALWLLGDVEAAAEHSDASLDWVTETTSSVASAQAWGMRALFHINRKELGEARRRADEVHAYCTDRNIPYWRHLSSMIGGWCRGRTDDLAGGLAQVEGSLADYLATGSRLGLPSLMVLAADLHRAAGQPEVGLERVRAAEAHVGRTGERNGLVGLLRCKGELLLDLPTPDEDAAESAFVESVAVARELGERVSELRATAMLLKFRHRRGLDDPESRERLGELCAWFGEDSGLADVRSALGLLDRLDAPAI